jgi:hypothetical protein
MIKKTKAALELFKAGKRVSDPVKWKNRQIESSVLVAAIWSVINAAEAFGYTIPVSSEVVDSAAVAILAVVNVVLTVTTTNKIGLSGKSDA